MTAHPLDAPRLVVYALPALADKAFAYPLAAIIPGFYLAYGGVGATALGLVLISARVLDAITDPLIGYLSDHTRSKFGPRKPWVLIGAFVSAAAAYFLFNPPSQAGALYFTAFMFLAYWGWTMFLVPYVTWGLELTGDYQGRSRIAAVRNAFGKLGFVAFLIVPFLPFFNTTAMTPEVVAGIGWLIVVIFPLFAIAAVTFVPQSRPVTTETAGFATLIGSVRANPPFQLFLLVVTCGGVGIGISATILLVFLEHYLFIGDKFAHIVIATSLAAVAAMPVWLRLLQGTGKHTAWAWGFIGQGVLTLMILLVPRGPDAFIPMLTLSLAMGFFMSPFLISGGAMLGDIIDYDILKSGKNRAGQYYAVFVFAVKLVAAISSGGAFLALGAAGFQADGPNPPVAEWTLLTVYSVVPAFFSFVGAALLRHYPIDRRRQSIIRRRIERRAARAGIGLPASAATTARPVNTRKPNAGDQLPDALHSPLPR